MRSLLRTLRLAARDAGPPLDRIRMLRAYLRLRRDDAEGALRLAKRLADGPAALVRAEALLQLRRPDEAVESAAAAASLLPGSPRAARVHGIAALEAGHFREAADALERAAAGGLDEVLRSQLGRAQLRAAAQLREGGAPGEAIPRLQRALELDPAHVAAALELARAYLDSGRDRDAVEAASALEADGAAEVTRRRLLARAFIRLGDHASALVAIDRAIAGDPSGAPDHFLRFRALRGMGGLTEAAAALAEARRRGDDPVFARREREIDGTVRVLTPGWLPELPEGAAPAPQPGRILHILERSLPYVTTGYTVRTHSTMKAQREAGLDPVAITRYGFPASEGADDREQRLDDLTYHFPPVDDAGSLDEMPLDERVRRSAAAAARLATSVRPAALQPATTHMNALVALALRERLGVPVVYELRGFQEDAWASHAESAQGSELFRLRRDIETHCAARADRVVTLAEVMKAELVERGIEPSRIAVVPNAADTDRFRPRPRDPELAASLGLEGRAVLGYVTTLSQYEGVDDLLRAIRILAARNPAVAGLVVGDGPEAARLHALASELGVADRVRFAGRIPHDRVPDYYSLIDVFVVPRRDVRVCRLVTPLKPFEALAMGLPLLVSDLGALREVASPPERGLSFEPERPESLAAQAEILLGDEALRRRLGEAGRAWVTRERTWSANAARYRDLYEELFSSRPTPR